MRTKRSRTAHRIFGLWILLSLLIGCGGGHSNNNPDTGTSQGTFFVAGWVSGLSGTAVLQLNDYPKMVITSNGFFQFKTQLPSGAFYEVKLLSSPGDQNSELTNNKGLIVDQNIMEVTLVFSERPWRHPAGLDEAVNPKGPFAYDVQVAMNIHGDVVMVWRQEYLGIPHLYMSEYRNKVWTRPNNLTDCISSGIHSPLTPSLTVNRKGNAVIAYGHQDLHQNDYLLKSELFF